MSAVGIGGVFFRADDPEALLAWYRKHLGVAPDDPFNWVTQTGQTVFMPFPRDTDHFPADRQWMLNFRVTALNTLLSSLQTTSSYLTQAFASLPQVDGTPNG